MKSYKLLEHQADVRIFAKSDTLEGLFSISLEALCEVIIPEFNKNTNEFHLEESIEIESIDSTALLIDFLSDNLFLMHQNKAIFCKVEFEFLSDIKLIAKVFGFRVNEFDEDVKAVTYHEAEIIMNDNQELETIILLDI